MKWLLVTLLFISNAASAQWKSYRLTNNDRDTINCIDQNDLKQGRWVVRVDGLRGEPGYEEEGVYKDGKKEGVWRAYTLMGDIYAIERYHWGNKDGRSQYYSMAGLVREESWKAVNPENPFDTVDVYDPVDPNKITKKIVKLEGSSVKHGQWKYYNTETGMIVKTENYFLGKSSDPFAKNGGTTTTVTTPTDTKAAKPAEKAKPKEVVDFEKKTGKRKVKVIDL